MSLSRLRVAVGLLAGLLAMPALACSFTIAFNTQFEPGADRLPASEVRRLAEWLIDEPGKYENQDKFLIILYAAPTSGISDALARKRASHLRHWLTMLHVPDSRIIQEVARYKPGKSAEPPNFAQVDFLPGCPHPCCPGMVPIVK
ncbi:hypothetical protein BKK80_01710 [Cupriavidus malaysiensis]|uniref:Uncharacterized protein n=2 Tax=Cupriavidus malaysiensis TaxID=367825 RepID=A0ABM6EZZ2_9BURK|nr:hypothetical protein BKK80_01710 [Cupriavidus malaysiensis]